MKLNLKSAALSVALALGASSAMAHSNSCDVDMTYDIQIDGKTITLSENDQEKVRIDGNNNLFLKGQKQSLNGQQQESLSDYASEVRGLIPVVNELAVEASALAVEAVTDVSTALLSDSPETAEKIQKRVDNLTSELKAYVSDNHLKSQKLEAYIEDSEFQDEVEGLVREVVADMVQGNIGNMIAAAIRGDEAEIEAFEARMEKFGEKMEQKYEAKAELIEKKAESLCDLVEKMDEKEDKFVKEFNDFEEYQLVKASD